MNEFFYGVIEGFYGREWSWQHRRNYAAFLSRHGFDCYIYAPKGDRYLRSSWREPLPEHTLEQLQALGDHYRNHGVRWGLGLSPLGLLDAFDASDKQALIEKVQQINTLKPDILCILFDDVRGDIPTLADNQLAVSDVILENSCAHQHILCPTYYSFDPVLEKVFGTMPEGYLSQLSRGLPDDIGLFWTGNQVISPRIEAADIERASDILGRRPILWDNYPVNDGRKTSQFLHLRPYQGRGSELRLQCEGHIVNPMNQPYLSELVLQSLSSVYKLGNAYRVELAWQDALASLGDGSLARSLDRDLERFQDLGLGGLSASEKKHLAEHYAAFSHPVAGEIVDWLQGGYQFDPACLTD